MAPGDGPNHELQIIAEVQVFVAGSAMVSGTAVIMAEIVLDELIQNVVIAVLLLDQQGGAHALMGRTAGAQFLLGEELFFEIRTVLKALQKDLVAFHFLPTGVLVVQEFQRMRQGGMPAVVKQTAHLKQEAPARPDPVTGFF